MNNKPLVSVIIINWNGGEVFKDCLKSLSKIDYKNWELIVVDNGSTDGSDKLVESGEWRVGSKLIHNNKNAGFAKANNQGIEFTKGKYILLLNNDTKVEPDFLSKLVGRMENDNSLGVIQPKIFLMDKKGYLDNAGSFLTWIGFLDHWGFMQKDGLEFNQEKEIFSAKGACMLIRKKIIDKVGLFDEDFFSYFEESDFCWRVHLLGYKVIFYPQARIYHKVGFTIKRLNVLDINFHYYKNRVCSLIKNLDGKNLFIILPLHLVISFGISGIFLLMMQPRNALMVISSLFWNLCNLSQTLKKRKIIQKMRLVKDKDFFKHLMQPIDYGKYWSDFLRVKTDIKRKVETVS